MFWNIFLDDCWFGGLWCFVLILLLYKHKKIVRTRGGSSQVDRALYQLEWEIIVVPETYQKMIKVNNILKLKKFM